MEDIELLILQGELNEDTPVLDLHGISAWHAKQEIESFLNRHFLLEDRVIKVIHGKGTGTLQHLCEEAAREHPLVDDYRPSMRPGEQGGALYIILAPRRIDKKVF